MIMDPLKILMLYINLRGWKRQTKWPFSHAWPHRGLTFIPPGVGSVILPDSLAPASPWRWCAVPAYWRGSGGSGSRCSWCPFWREACDVSQCIYTFPTKIKGKYSITLCLWCLTFPTNQGKYSTQYEFTKANFMVLKSYSKPQL